ncbi:MAG: hypothetical protein R2788_00480 [Saprospiraceae bacterium]
MKTVLFILAFALLSFPTISQNSFDKTFGENGVLLTTYGFHQSLKNFVYILDTLPNEQIMMGGLSGGDIVLAKINNDGTLDDTFGEEGIALYSPPFDYNYLGDFDIQTDNDGRILILGSSVSYGGYDPTTWVVRFNPDGRLDEEFAPFGFEYLEVGQGFGVSEPEAVIVQPDGKFVIAGSAYTSGWSGFVKRYHPSGEPDSTFGINGYLDVEFGTTDQTKLGAVSLLSDGKFMVGGYRLTRLNPDGSTDMTFGNSGLVDPGFQIQSLVIQPDGKILIVGNPGYITKIMRYHSDGTIDLSYGENGQITVQAGAAKRMIEQIILQPNGKLVAVGGITLPEKTYYSPDISTILRFTKDGKLDEDFDGDGIAETDLRAEKSESATCATILPDGKILAGGYVYEQWYRSDFTLMRFVSDEKEDIDPSNEGMDSIEIIVPEKETFLFPNPVIDAATLYYYQPKFGKVSIHLYANDGKLLHTFIKDQFRDEGQHKELLEWPIGVHSGVYLIVVASKDRQIGVTVFHKN